MNSPQQIRFQSSLTGTFLDSHEVTDEFDRIVDLFHSQYPNLSRPVVERQIARLFVGFSIVYCVYDSVDLIGIGIGCQRDNSSKFDYFQIEDNARILGAIEVLPHYDSIELRHTIGRRVISRLTETGATRIYASCTQPDTKGTKKLLRSLKFQCESSLHIPGTNAIQFLFKYQPSEKTEPNARGDSTKNSLRSQLIIN